MLYFNRLNILWVICLAVLFFTSYGSVNHIAAYMDKLGMVETVSFNWESSIPFIPIFIYPYMSIDFLYGLAFFIIPKNKYEPTLYKKIINGLGLQLLVNQIFSLICFLAFPLKCEFQKPDIPEQYKSVFDALLSFDLPYNQAPSLHISILVILWCFYNKHILNKFIRYSLNVWFVMIGLSIVFCYQHQIIDFILGFIVGLGVVYAFEVDPQYNKNIEFNPLVRKTNFYKNFRNSLIIGFIVLFLLSILGNLKYITFKIDAIYGLILMVFYFSCLMLFKMQFFDYHSVIRVNDKFKLSFKYLHFVYMFFRDLYIKSYKTYEKPVNLMENLWIGNLHAINNHKEEENDIYINLTFECENNKEKVIHYPLIDLTTPSLEQVRVITNEINKNIIEGKRVHIHCAMGLFRTIFISLFYLKKYQGYSNEDLKEIIKRTGNRRLIKYFTNNEERFFKLLNNIN